MLKKMPRGVWMLGFVSLFMDLSSEMIHALLPIYLTTVLGLSAATAYGIVGLPGPADRARRPARRRRRDRAFRACRACRCR